MNKLIIDIFFLITVHYSVYLHVCIPHLFTTTIQCGKTSWGAGNARKISFNAGRKKVQMTNGVLLNWSVK
jgi:hypothetical protein